MSQACTPLFIIGYPLSSVHTVSQPSSAQIIICSIITALCLNDTVFDLMGNQVYRPKSVFTFIDYMRVKAEVEKLCFACQPCITSSRLPPGITPYRVFTSLGIEEVWYSVPQSFLLLYRVPNQVLMSLMNIRRYSEFRLGYGIPNFFYTQRREYPSHLYSYTQLYFKSWV